MMLEQKGNRHSTAAFGPFSSRQEEQRRALDRAGQKIISNIRETQSRKKAFMEMYPGDFGILAVDAGKWIADRDGSTYVDVNGRKIETNKVKTVYRELLGEAINSQPLSERDEWLKKFHENRRRVLYPQKGKEFVLV